MNSITLQICDKKLFNVVNNQEMMTFIYLFGKTCIAFRL